MNDVAAAHACGTQVPGLEQTQLQMLLLAKLKAGTPVFPGPKVDVLTPETLGVLGLSTTVVTPKTHGERFLLFGLQIPQHPTGPIAAARNSTAGDSLRAVASAPAQHLRTRAHVPDSQATTQIYLVNGLFQFFRVATVTLPCSKSFLLDGEMCPDTSSGPRQRGTYFVFDVYLFQNVCLQDRALLDRFQYAFELGPQLSECNTMPLRVVPKQMFAAQTSTRHVMGMLGDARLVPYPTDGMVVVDGRPYGKSYKCKTSTDTTVDFLLVPSGCSTTTLQDGSHRDATRGNPSGSRLVDDADTNPRKGSNGNHGNNDSRAKDMDPDAAMPPEWRLHLDQGALPTVPCRLVAGDGPLRLHGQGVYECQFVRFVTGTSSSSTTSTNSSTNSSTTSTNSSTTSTNISTGIDAANAHTQIAEWVVVRLRKDKVRPNSVHVFDSSMALLQRSDWLLEVAQAAEQAAGAEPRNDARQSQERSAFVSQPPPRVGTWLLPCCRCAARAPTNPPPHGNGCRSAAIPCASNGILLAGVMSTASTQAPKRPAPTTTAGYFSADAELRRTSASFAMKLFHNVAVKDRLYQLYLCNATSLLELGVGRGGDVNRIRAHGTSLRTFVALDSDRAAVAECRRRWWASATQSARHVRHAELERGRTVDARPNFSNNNHRSMVGNASNGPAIVDIEVVDVGDLRSMQHHLQTTKKYAFPCRAYLFPALRTCTSVLFHTRCAWRACFVFGVLARCA